MWPGQPLQNFSLSLCLSVPSPPQSLSIRLCIPLTDYILTVSSVPPIFFFFSHNSVCLTLAVHPSEIKIKNLLLNLLFLVAHISLLCGNINFLWEMFNLGKKKKNPHLKTDSNTLGLWLTWKVNPGFRGKTLPSFSTLLSYSWLVSTRITQPCKTVEHIAASVP